MKQQTLVQRLSAGVAAARRSTTFCVSGSLPNTNPDIHVTGVGPLKLPLGPTAAKRVLAVCQQAPYGKGTETLVDTKVRKSFVLAPAQFTLTNPQWDEAIRATVHSVAGQLGLPADQLEPELYKLLLYRTGGFFLPHRDGEKSNRMVGTLIIALPTPFEGGVLSVRHQGSTQHLAFQEAATGRAPCFAAFYADCEHEVSKVTRGLRLCLVYTLVLRVPKRGKQAAAPVAETTPASELARSISGWVTTKESEPLVFAFDHHYTQRGLSRDLLKGSDRATAELVIAAAEQAGCHTYFCQVSRHLVQFADDGSSGRRWQSSVSVPRNLELGEVYDDELQGEGWVDTGGKRQPFPAMSLGVASIVASTPIDQWKPTQEEYEGYTGNAGNTLDRWYHRSAVCVWHRDHHFDVLARGDVESAIDMLRGMVGKLAKTPKKRIDEARGECSQLARAIIRQWPKRPTRHFGLGADRDKVLNAFPALLMKIDDPDATCQLLRCVAPQDTNLELAKLIVAACRRHGCEMFASELTAIFATSRDGVCERDFRWLDQLACARLDDPVGEALITHLARLAATQFCQPLPPQHYHREDPTHAERTLPALLRILLISADEPTLERVIRFVSSHPERFTTHKVQVPCLEQVVAWCRKQRAVVHPLVMEWLRSLQQTLTTATAQEPQPPTDWARPAEIACTCQYCRQLNAILADPIAETGRVSAREDLRSHVIQKIYTHQCDVTHKLEKKGSPHALVLTKTTGSFQRRMQRYVTERALLETIQGLLLSQGATQ